MIKSLVIRFGLHTYPYPNKGKRENVTFFMVEFYGSNIVVVVLFYFQATTKEGYLLKQTWSFQRWRRRYFRLKGHRLYYAKDAKVSNLFALY